MRKLHILLYIVTICVIILSIFQVTSGYAQESLTGDWEGTINVQGTELKIITHFSYDDSLTGTIDIPQQGGQDIPLQKISLAKQDSVYFEFMAGLGMAEFRGKMKNDTTITGTFHQNGRQFPFKLIKNSSSTVKTNTSTTPPTYNQEEIIINNNSVAIGGTLTWPKDQQPDELVIIISGSGAQNRNGKLPGIDFKPYQVLADSLTSNGIATFRYDDRGVGKSGGNFSETSLSMLVSDVEAIINYFRNSSSRSFAEIMLLGHSQGGIVGSKVAAKNNNIDKLILLASPALPLGKIILNQVKTLNQEAGVADSILAKNVALQKAIFDTLRGSQNFSSLEDSLVKFDTLAKPSITAEMARQQIRNQLQYLTKPSYFSLLDYDPTQDLNKLQIPVLAIFGGKDTQVDLEMNQSPLKSALQKAGASHQVKIFPEANHLFQEAQTGSVSEYASLKSKFVDGFISTLTEWIKK